MTTTAQLGIVTVYDATTGLATAPVAVVAWTPTDLLRWGWIPNNPVAERLRHLAIDDLDAAGQTAWLNRYAADPGSGYAVTVFADDVTAATAPRRVDDALVDLILQGF